MVEVSAEGEGEEWSELTGAEGGKSTQSVDELEKGTLDIDVEPGTAIFEVFGASRRTVLVGEAGVKGFGFLLCDALLVGEAGPDFVGETGLTGGADGTFLSADDGGRGTV